MIIRTPKPSVDNQHFVTLTADGTTETTCVYADSMDAAIKAILELFAKSDLTVARPAVGDELPWKRRICLVASRGRTSIGISFGGMALQEALIETALSYEGYDVRVATAEEAERMCRETQLDNDLRDAEDLAAGFQAAKAANDLLN